MATCRSRPSRAASAARGSCADCGTSWPRTRRTDPAGSDPAHITVIANTADDVTLFGLRVCPDLDTLMYTLGGGIHEGQGWGRAEETYAVKDELAAYGAEPQWFGLGDRDLATHIVRSQMLDQGYPLSAVTEALCTRWEPGVRLLPMTDQRVETHVTIGEGAERRAVHFQEWWVRLHAVGPGPRDRPDRHRGRQARARRPRGHRQRGRDPAAAVQPDRLDRHDPRGARRAGRAWRRPRASVVGVSPIIGNAPVHGMADACLTALGLETSPSQVARLYSLFLRGWLVAEEDLAAGSDVPEGVVVRGRPLLMSDPPATQALARAAFDLALELSA